MAFQSVADIKAANAARGHHYFDADTLRFFRSQVDVVLYGGRYFVTSEQNTGMGGPYPRRWSVREALPDASIDSASEFGQFGSMRSAKAYARELAETDGSDYLRKTIRDMLSDSRMANEKEPQTVARIEARFRDWTGGGHGFTRDDIVAELRRLAAANVLSYHVSGTLLEDVYGQGPRFTQ